jgi:hypothetical protein
MVVSEVIRSSSWLDTGQQEVWGEVKKMDGSGPSPHAHYTFVAFNGF